MTTSSEAEALARQHAAFPGRLALIYAGLGDTDRVFEALEQMAAERDPRIGMYLSYPELAAVRRDPRWHMLRRSLGFR